MAINEKEYIDPKYLEDGKVLNKLKMMFLSTRTKESLTPLLACLRDAVVLVPKESDTIKQGDKLYFPMFSIESELPKEALEFTMNKVTVVSCIQRALMRKELSGLVIDPFTKPLIIVPELANIIMDLPSLMESGPTVSVD